jgi:hypothetical protein
MQKQNSSPFCTSSFVKLNHSLQKISFHRCDHSSGHLRSFLRRNQEDEFWICVRSSGPPYADLYLVEDFLFFRYPTSSPCPPSLLPPPPLPLPPTAPTNRPPTPLYSSITSSAIASLPAYDQSLLSALRRQHQSDSVALRRSLTRHQRRCE